MLFLRDGREAQIFGNRFAIEGEAAAGQGSAAQGADVDVGAGLLEALVIAGEHFEIG